MRCPSYCSSIGIHRRQLCYTKEMLCPKAQGRPELTFVEVIVRMDVRLRVYEPVMPVTHEQAPVAEKDETVCWESEKEYNNQGTISSAYIQCEIVCINKVDDQVDARIDGRGAALPDTLKRAL